MSISRVGSIATLVAATLGSFATSHASEQSSATARTAPGSAGEQQTAFFGLFGCGTNCGYGCGGGYRACSPYVSYGGCYPRPVYGGCSPCGPSYGGYYGSPVISAPVYGVPSYGYGAGGCGVGGYGVPGYGAPMYGAPGLGAPGYGTPIYGPYGSRSTTPSLPVVNRPGSFRSTAFEQDQDSPFYP